MPQFLPAVRGTFERSSPQQRIMSVVALLFIAAGIFAFVQFGKEGAYVALFPSSLDQQQLTEVVDRLTQDQVQFEATADNVTVPYAKKGDIRLRLLTEGVPHAHVMTRADALKAAGPLTPTAELEEAQKNGLEGDIAENLRSITGIRDAHVIIAPAKQGTFVLDEDHDASAMVQLTLEPGVTLPPQAINSLRQEVASAVPGLSPEHVTINDQSMSLLADGGSGAGNTDKSLESKVNATLDKIFGAGNAFATVDVETQGSATTSHEVKHVPLQDKPIATDADREHYVGKNKSYDKVHENSDRGSDTIETNTQIAAGSIRRKTVAVFVSDRVATPAALAQLPSTIGAVAGIDAARGDVIKVQGIRMAGAPGPNAPAPAPNATGPAVPQPMLAGMPWPIFLLVALSVAAISSMGWIYRPQADHKDVLAMRATTQLAADEFEPVRIHASLRDEPPHAVAAILANLPAPTTTAVLELYGTDERREIVKRLTKQIAPVVRDVSDASGRG